MTNATNPFNDFIDSCADAAWDLAFSGLAAGNTIHRAYRKLRLGPPTRVHISPKTANEAWDAFAREAKGCGFEVVHYRMPEERDNRGNRQRQRQAAHGSGWGGEKPIPPEWKLAEEGRDYHELKTIPPFFADIEKGLKTFEIRKNDRDFRVGDRLLLREFRWDDGLRKSDYTGREVWVRVTYLLATSEGWLPPGYVAMAIVPCEPEPGRT